jgi:hypothetical protein
MRGFAIVSTMQRGRVSPPEALDSENTAAALQRLDYDTASRHFSPVRVVWDDPRSGLISAGSSGELMGSVRRLVRLAEKARA